MTPPQDLARALGRRLDSPWPFCALFEYLPDTYFYVKDTQSRFLAANQALAEMLGFRSPEELLGRTDRDFFPRDLAEQYIAEDARVLAAGRPVANQAWLVPDYRGELKWYLSSKIPLSGDGGRTIGLAGVLRDVAKASALLKPYVQMEDVLRHVLDHFDQRLSMEQLARMVGLSLSQFDRRFKRLFQMTPQQFLLRVRVNAAGRMLADTDRPVADIAQQTGFYDQSYFTKHFRRQMKLTPTAYRQAYRTAPVDPVAAAAPLTAKAASDRSGRRLG